MPSSSNSGFSSDDIELFELVSEAARKLSDSEDSDLAHTAFLQLRRREIPSEKRNPAYVYSAVESILKSRRRRDRAERARHELAWLLVRGPSSGHADLVESPQVLGARRELNSLLHKAIEDLPDGLSRVMRMRYFEDMPQVEIARRLGVDSRTVRAREMAARERLRVELLKRDVRLEDLLGPS